jgi:hypothetical protein
MSHHPDSSARTPVGSFAHVDEPRPAGVSDASIYFRLWEAGKNFGLCAWASKRTSAFLAVGDPFVKK